MKIPSIVLICCILLGHSSVAAATRPSESRDRLSLSGIVVDQSNRPLNNASVFIYSAKPHQGSSTLCPYCYADCSKSETTDENGAFTLSQLDPTLSFRLLTIAEGYRPTYTQYIRPESGTVTIDLTARNDHEYPLNQKVRGRITNRDGEPIVGAAIAVEGIQEGGYIRWSPGKNIDPLALSDANGLFTLTSKAPFIAANVKIKARNYAPLIYNGLRSGKNWAIQLADGVSVEGRVLKKGEPMPGLTVILTGQDRTAGSFVGHFEIATNKDGRFLFLNLPVDTDFYLSGKIRDFEPHGALRPRPVHTPTEGKIDLGELKIEPSLSISGRILLPAAESIPDQTRILLSSERGWDTKETIVPADGSFEFAGLTRENYSLTVRIPNHRFAFENPNLAAFSATRLEGFLGNDLTNLTILMEEGERLDSESLEKHRRQYGVQAQFRSPAEIPPRFISSNLN